MNWGIAYILFAAFVAVIADGLDKIPYIKYNPYVRQIIILFWLMAGFCVIMAVIIMIEGGK